MDILSLATKSITIGDDIQQGDEDLQIDIDKLIGIANDLVYMTDDFIFSIYVSPMSILQKKLKEVKDVKFHIVYNAEYTGTKYVEAKELCTSLLDEFCKNEFDGLDGVSYIDYSTRMFEDESALILYSVFGEFDVNSLDDSEYMMLWNLLQETGYSISAPNTFPYERKHSIMLHCQSYVDVPRMGIILKEVDKRLGTSIIQEEAKPVKIKKFAYIPIVGLKKVEYGIPYTYITKDSFDQQRLECLLNKDE